MSYIRARELRELFDVVRFAFHGGKGAQQFYDDLCRVSGLKDEEPKVTIASQSDLDAFLSRRR